MPLRGPRQRRGDLAGQAQRLGQRQWPAARFQPAAERLALQKLHDDVRHAVGQLAELGDLHDSPGGGRC